MITKMISLEKWAACALIIVTEGVEICSLVSLSNWLKRTGFLSIFHNTLLETNARVQISDFTRIILKNLRHFRPVSTHLYVNWLKLLCTTIKSSYADP